MQLSTRIFLGGTVGVNPWREKRVIPALLSKGIPQEALFNPIVLHWDKQAQEQEDQMKQDPHVLLLFVLATPDNAPNSSMVSGYSLVEAVMSLYDAPHRTVVVFDPSLMARRTARSMAKAMDDVRRRFPDAPIFSAYAPAIDWLVAHFSEEADPT